MRLLLDTHLYLWVTIAPQQLPATAASLINAAVSSGDAVFVSAASIREASIKASLGKLSVNPGALARAIQPSGFQDLPVSTLHAAGVSHLRWHHKDPFDRILVAQAWLERLTLVTVDPVLVQYGSMVQLVS